MWINLRNSIEWKKYIYLSGMAIYFKRMLLNLKKQVGGIHTSFRGIPENRVGDRYNLCFLGFFFLRWGWGAARWTSG